MTDNTHDELPRLLKLGAVALTLPRTACGKEHILGLAIDILLPMSQPGHRVVVLNRLPFTRNVGLGWRNVLGHVQDNVLWTEAVLECALTWVLATTTEQSWRLGTEVACLLLSAVDNGVEIRLLKLVLGLLYA